MNTRNLNHRTLLTVALVFAAVTLWSMPAFAHGTSVSPISRVYRVYLANPDNPAFPLAAQAVATDGTLSYYTWNELSRNISAAVTAGLPPGFDYSPWIPDGQLASAGRVDPSSTEYPRTYAGLDQVTSDWPTTPVNAGETIEVDFVATAPHDPSVWDVWMTTPDWDPATPLNWAQMEFLGRPSATLISGSYYFDVQIPNNRVGHHVMWIAWQRDDPVGEVFISTSDLMILANSNPDEFRRGDCNGDGNFDVSDAVVLLGYLFLNLTLDCERSGDINDDGALGLVDPIGLLNYLFLQGAAPAPPHPVCGLDPTSDGLACDSASCP